MMTGLTGSSSQWSTSSMRLQKKKNMKKKKELANFV
jgi:hypothetical protein